MPSNVNGLTTIQQERPRVRSRGGRVTPERPRVRSVALRPTASPVDTYVRPDAMPQDHRTQLLVNSLAGFSSGLTQAAASHQQAEAQEQQANQEYYTQMVRQFQKDKESGAITQAQVKKMFPELVPTVAARVAQSVGQLDAREWVQGQVQQVLEDDSIRLDTGKRQAFLDEVRANAAQRVGDNHFYGSGFLSQVDHSLNEFESSWMRETAAYHQQVQTDAFSHQVEDALSSGGNLLELDKQWKDSSSLNNLERNQIVVNTALSKATTDQDAGVLDQIPKRFLNAESKAKVERVRNQIEGSRFSKWRRAKMYEDEQRKAQVRQRKTEILSRLANNEDINPAEYYDDPDVASFAMRAMDAPSMNPRVSHRNAEFVKDRILQAATAGNYMDAFSQDPNFRRFFGDEENVTVESMQDYIMNLQGLNPTERSQLVEQVPQLMEGVAFMRDSDVTSTYRTVEEDIQAFMQNPAGGAIVLQTQGINPQSAVRNEFDDYLRTEIMAEIEEGHGIPHGYKKRDLIRQAKKAALDKLAQLQRQAMSGGHSTPRADDDNSGPSESNNDNVVDWGDIN